MNQVHTMNDIQARRLQEIIRALVRRFALAERADMSCCDMTVAQAATLEAFKDLSIAGASFFLASYVPRFGYRRTMLVGLMAVMLASMLVAAVTGFWVNKTPAASGSSRMRARRSGSCRIRLGRL